jgi:DNA-binding MurR/RpiR family transcriptional regulator
MQESAPKLSLHQCREVTRVRSEQVQKLVTSAVSKDEIYSQVSDAFTQMILALAEFIGDEEVNKNVEALVKAYDQLDVQLGIRPYITEIEDVDEGEPENPVDEV